MGKIVYVLTIINEYGNLSQVEVFGKELDAHTAMVEQMMEKRNTAEKDRCIVFDNWVITSLIIPPCFSAISFLRQ